MVPYTMYFFGFGLSQELEARIVQQRDLFQCVLYGAGRGEFEKSVLSKGSVLTNRDFSEQLPHLKKRSTVKW
jgi:hypothetical protein